MATANLTKRVIDSLEFSPNCDYFVWDAKLTGFGVRVTERAARKGQIHRRKAFVVGYRPRGSNQFRRLSLGVFGPMTVEQARIAALRHLALVSDGQVSSSAYPASQRETQDLRSRTILQSFRPSQASEAGDPPSLDAPKRSS